MTSLFQQVLAWVAPPKARDRLIALLNDYPPVTYVPCTPCPGPSPTSDVDNILDPRIYDAFRGRLPVQLLSDENMPQNLCDGLALFLSKVPNSQISDMWLEVLEQDIASRRRRNTMRVETKTDVNLGFQSSIGEAVDLVCQGLSMEFIFYKPSRDKVFNIAIDYTYEVVPTYVHLAIIEEVCPAIADVQFSDLVRRSKSKEFLTWDFEGLNGGSGHDIAKRLSVLMLDKGLEYGIVHSLKDFVFLRLVTVGEPQRLVLVVSDVVSRINDASKILRTLLSILLRSHTPSPPDLLTDDVIEGSPNRSGSLTSLSSSTLKAVTLVEPSGSDQDPLGLKDLIHERYDRFGDTYFWNPPASLESRELAAVLGTLPSVTVCMKPFTEARRYYGFKSRRLEDSTIFVGLAISGTKVLDNLEVVSASQQSIVANTSMQSSIPFHSVLDTEILHDTRHWVLSGYFKGAPHLRFYHKSFEKKSIMDHELNLYRSCFRYLAGKTVPGLYGAYHWPDPLFGEFCELLQEDCGETIYDLWNIMGFVEDLSCGVPRSMRCRIWHAVLEIHEAGVQHNDIRPPNVTYRKHDDRLFIIDFDLAERHQCPGPNDCEELCDLKVNLGL